MSVGRELRRLAEAVRDQDTVARLGGDEFVLVLDGFVSRDEVESFLERLKNAFSEPFSAGGRLLAVRGSMRPVAESDRPLLRRWLEPFSREAGGDLGDAETVVTRALALETRGLYLYIMVESLAEVEGLRPVVGM